jgi:hypothetical protein
VLGKSLTAQCAETSKEAIDDFRLPYSDLKKIALARFTIRKMQAGNTSRVTLRSDFFKSLEMSSLPTPAEASDNLILWLAGQADGSPGKQIGINYSDYQLRATIGVVTDKDLRWITESLEVQRLISGTGNDYQYLARLTAQGWRRFEDLKRAYISSQFAFFARQFSNPDLDGVFDRCLRPAVKETGYDLRTVTQRAGLIDATIEDEIRSCRFMIADLSDDNAGAYWEAGFAEDLGKPVIYICRATDAEGKDKRTHFDANHRHCVRWDLKELARTAVQLKAVIRNTLLGDAIQGD